MSYFMWTEHWPITELRQFDRDALKIVTEGGGKHPCGTTFLLPAPRIREGDACVPLRPSTRRRRLKGFLTDEYNRLALDRVKSMSALSAHSAVKSECLFSVVKHIAATAKK